MPTSFASTPSFIPKTRLTAPTYRKKGFELGILAAAFILFVSIAMFGGVYFYRDSIKSQIASKKQSLIRAKEAFEPALISELSRLNSAINSAQVLLDKHQAASKIFKLIGDLTLKETVFSNFQYRGASLKDRAVVSMAGETTGYTGVAQQARLLEDSEAIDQVKFSGLSLKEGGRISFSVEIEINPSHLIYQP